MNTKTKRQLLLSLIKADLINCKLVFGLHELGLNAGAYFTDLNELIFSLAGIPQNARGEILHETYFNLTAKTKEIDIHQEPDALRSLSEEIYQWLRRQKGEDKKRKKTGSSRKPR